MSRKLSISNSFSVNTIKDSQGCCIIARGGCKRENNTYSESSVTIYNGKTTNKTNNSGNEFPADTSGHKRGFALTIINKDTLEVIGRIMYDVYYSAQRVDDLIAKLQTISSDYIICICSADYIIWTTTLINALKNFGCGEIENPQDGNYPFAFIGRRGMPAGTAIFKLGSRFQVEPVEVKAFVAGGNLLPINDGEKGEQGEQGERGKTGRWYYYGGVFNENDNSQSFYVNDTQIPFFSTTFENNTYYYLFDPVTPTKEQYTMAEMWTASSRDFSKKPWVMMSASFKYIITEAIFGKYAHFGGAIINGDWMISQYGKIGDTNVTSGSQYTYFDPLYPDVSENTYHITNSGSWAGYNFVPNYAVNLKTGETYMQRAFVSGSIYTKSIQTQFEKIQEVFPSPTEFIVGVDGTNGIWNFEVTGKVIIILPTNLYTHYGQRVIIYNPYFAIGGSYEETIIVASPVEYDDDNDVWYYANDEDSGLAFDALRGIGTAVDAQPIAINSFNPVKQINFANGIVELMCVPTSDPNRECDWCVVNIGTNIYELRENVNVNIS